MNPRQYKENALKLWDRMAETGEDKTVAYRKLGLEDCLNECHLCQYVYDLGEYEDDGDDIFVDCDYCPIANKWPTANGERVHRTCVSGVTEESAFMKQSILFPDIETRKNLNKMIADAIRDCWVIEENQINDVKDETLYNIFELAKTHPALAARKMAIMNYGPGFVHFIYNYNKLLTIYQLMYIYEDTRININKLPCDIEIGVLELCHAKATCRNI